MGKITKNKFKRTGICQITKKEYPLNELMPGFSVHESVAKLIREKYPDWNPEGYICIDELNKFRHEYIKNILESEKGE
ncbi:MAG: hypothetical protein Q6360_00925 [Candidatus Brocadiales bacterium]|nr:hypothetical protein [Candidatus Brocadiales bacterium]